MKRILQTLLALSLAGMTLAQTDITLTGYGGQDPAIVVRLIEEVIGDELEAAGINLTYQAFEGDYNGPLFNALSAGTAGDIIYIPDSTAPGIIATGKILPLNDVFDAEPFIDSLIEVYKVDDNLYGVAKDFNTLALFYNKDLFDEAGVEYPNETDTWQTLAEKLRAVDALGDDVHGICLPADYARFGAFAYANGWDPMIEEGETNLLDERFVAAVEWYTGLVEEGVAIQPSDIAQSWAGGCFGTGNVAAAIEGAWILGFLRNEAPNLQYGTTYLPLAPSGERGNFLFTVAYGVNTDSPNREAALKVLELLTSPEAQQWVLEQGLAIPSREAMADNPYFEQDTPEATANKVIFESASMGNVYGYQFGEVGTDWFAPINNALVAIMTGQAEVEPALQQAQEAIDALLERNQ